MPWVACNVAFLARLVVDSKQASPYVLGHWRRVDEIDFSCTRSFVDTFIDIPSPAVLEASI